MLQRLFQFSTILYAVLRAEVEQAVWFYESLEIELKIFT
jgi:hypothetical protein